MKTEFTLTRQKFIPPNNKYGPLKPNKFMNE